MTLFNKSARVAAVLACATAFAGLAGCQSQMEKDKQQMMMNAPGDIIDVATGPNMERVTTLVQAVKAAGLVDTLKGSGPFTVFAPTNEAFAALPPGTLDMLMKPENKDKLKAILLYHVHVGDAYPAAEVKTMALSTADGDKKLSIVKVGDAVMVNDAKVIKADIPAKNGVIHWIDKVVMPPTMGDMPMMSGSGM